MNGEEEKSKVSGSQLNEGNEGVLDNADDGDKEGEKHENNEQPHQGLGKHQPNPHDPRSLSSGSTFDNFKQRLLQNKLVAIVVLVFVVIIPVVQAIKLAIEIYSEFHVKLFLRSLHSKYVTAMGAPVKIDLDLILAGKQMVIADDIRLSFEYSRLTEAGHDLNESKDRCTLLSSRELQVPPLDTKIEKLTQSIDIRCHEEGIFKVRITAASSKLEQAAYADLTIEVLPGYIKCLSDLALKSDSPVLVFDKDKMDMPYMIGARNPEEFKILVLSEAQETNPLKATIWLKRAMIYKLEVLGGAHLGYEIYVDHTRYEDGLYGSEKICDSEIYATHLLKTIDQNLLLEQISEVTPFHPGFAPIGNSAYTVEIHNDRIKVRDVESQQCNQVKVTKIGESGKERGYGSIWSIPSLSMSVESYHWESGRGYLLGHDSSITVGRWTARSTETPSEKWVEELPLVTRAGEGFVESGFVFLDNPGDLQARHCKPPDQN
ncbi:hypothetical protein [Nitrosospira multiformis]|uniref:Uncharacterized protein n=1 Tax=Nitrosospira multiformis TaxID=1231 RepID=A0A1I7I551_9PROT|nr:hypothetical protein [Nitrosospira multiformis]SFU68075.1 hypothetical protein SAMN05216417_11468 [Nitrosospira multiformis]